MTIVYSRSAMKTVSTKLDNSDLARFQELCNESGLCASEYLRDRIKDDIRADNEFNEI